MSLFSLVLGSILLGQVQGGPWIEQGVPRIPPLPNEANPPAGQPQRQADGTRSVPATAGQPQPSGVVPASAVQPIETPAGPALASPAAAFPAAPNLMPSGEAAGRLNPQRSSPADLVAEATSLPPGGPVTGRPVSLVTVFSTVTERRQQGEAVHAYWRLAEAVGEFRAAYERQQRLARLKPQTDEAAAFRAAQAIAAAQAGEAEVLVSTAQHDLAALMLLPPDSPLPVPADRPHTGPYRTYFAELFAGRTAPDRVRVIDRALPLRARSIAGHAAAVEAAEDAADAAIELQMAGRGNMATVVECLNTLIRQQRAFLAAVSNYNHEIADYALAVVPAQATPQMLAGTLVRPNSIAAPAGAAGRTLPATHVEPVGAAPSKPEPTRVIAPPAIPPIEPASATPPPGNPLRGGTSGDLEPRPAKPATRNDEEPPKLAPPAESAIPLDPGSIEPAPKRGAAPTNIDGPTLRTTNKPVTEQSAAHSATSAVYPGLANLAAGEQTAQLAAALHWDRNLPPKAGSPVGMATCLEASPAADRSELVAAYWKARQAAAEYQAVAEQGQWLEGLAPAAMGQAAAPPTTMLRFRAARLAFEVRRLDAELELLWAEYALAARMGRGMETDLPLPSSVPATARPAVAAGAAPRTWAVRRAEAATARLEERMTRQATAVVEADAARAEAVAGFHAGRRAVEQLLATIEVQSEQTSAFLQSLTDYNRAIGDYAVAVLPPDAKAEKFVAFLMVK